MPKQTIVYKTLEELPAVLKAEHIGKVLGLSRPVVYNLMNSAGFPVIKIGKRLIVPKPAFEEWLEKSTGTSIVL